MIPVYEPDIGDEEIAAVVDAMRRGEISGSFGASIPTFEQAFARYCGRKFGVAVTSGTTALHLAVAALGLQRGDQILMSACTNIATALAAYHNGCTPVPVDSEDVTWNLDLDLIEGLITPRTRAILPVHLYGHPVDMDALLAIARRHDLVVIEDCAESHGATCRGRMTGSFGEMSCFSFYANKIITTGEGGMVLTDDATLAERLRLLRNLAFTTPRFRHEIAGYNFRMTGFQAAMGLAQLSKIERIVADKRRVASLYSDRLGDVEGIRLPAEREWARSVYWMYAIVVTPEAGVTRDELARRLLNDGIETRTFFCPIGQQPFVRAQIGHLDVPCPVADRLWETGLYLPSSSTLDEATVDRIGESVSRAVHGAGTAV